MTGGFFWEPVQPCRQKLNKLAGFTVCGKSQNFATRLDKEHLSRHARTRRTSRKHVQLPFIRKTSAAGSSAAARAGDDRSGVAGPVGSVSPVVFAPGAALDRPRRVVAGSSSPAAVPHTPR